MYAFAPVTPVAAAKPVVGKTSFATPLSSRPVRQSNAPTMTLVTNIRRPVDSTSVYGYVATILSKADTYMSDSVRKQYLAISNPMGTFNVQCTEGSVKFAAEAARIRALGTRFRHVQASVSKKKFDLFENRKSAIAASHECHHEETQFSEYAKVAATYNISKSEALGQCIRYANPETVAEAAMLRFMDITQNNHANPSGVYNVWCNEGTVKGQAEEIRVAALNTAFRQGQKSILKIMDEKYQQKRAGYARAHLCTYEEGLISKYPAIGAAFRPLTYGS